MSFDIHIDVSYNLKSQAGVCDLKGLGANAEIETESSGNPATHRQGGGGGIPKKRNRQYGSFRSDGGCRPHSRRFLSSLRLEGSNCRRSMYRRRRNFGRATRGCGFRETAATWIED